MLLEALPIFNGMKTKKIIIGNWKANPLSQKDALKLAKGFQKIASRLKQVETVICVPYMYALSLGKLSRKIAVGVQDVFWTEHGARTGEITPDMLQAAGITYVIVGHSERRALGETDEMVNKKIKACLKFGVTPIVCVGETVRDKNMNYLKTLKNQIKETFKRVQKRDLEKVIIAYEPVWAISTSKKRHNATAADSLEMVIYIKKVLTDLFKDQKTVERIPFIYGGSANAKNAEEFLSDGGVVGLLPGHASLDAKEFGAMLLVAEKTA